MAEIKSIIIRDKRFEGDKALLFHIKRTKNGCVEATINKIISDYVEIKIVHDDRSVLIMNQGDKIK